MARTRSISCLWREIFLCRDKRKYNVGMARKTLYDIIDEFEVSPAQAFSRILYYFDGKVYDTTYCNYGHTLKYYINDYLFKSLPIRKAGGV